MFLARSWGVKWYGRYLREPFFPRLAGFASSETGFASKQAYPAAA